MQEIAETNPRMRPGTAWAIARESGVTSVADGTFRRWWKEIAAESKE
jgi:hypothetical protein